MQLSTITLEGHTEQEMKKETAVELGNKERNPNKTCCLSSPLQGGGSRGQKRRQNPRLQKQPKRMRLLFWEAKRTREQTTTPRRYCFLTFGVCHIPFSTLALTNTACSWTVSLANKLYFMNFPNRTYLAKNPML